MAKKSKKKKAVRGGKVFEGNFQDVRKAINVVAKSVEAARKKAKAQVAKGKTAAKGESAATHLAANKATLRQAERMLVGLKKAKTMMGKFCCQQDQGCDLFILN